MKLFACDATYTDTKFSDRLRHTNPSEYGRSEDRQEPREVNCFSGLFVSLAYHPSSVIRWGVLGMGQQGSEFSACKLSERVSPVKVRFCRCFFFFLPVFLFLKHGVMTNERYQQLMDNLELSLTDDEQAEGWHFCHEFDGLLVKGDPNEKFCGKACIEWEGQL